MRERSISVSLLRLVQISLRIDEAWHQLGKLFCDPFDVSYMRRFGRQHPPIGMEKTLRAPFW